MCVLRLGAWLTGWPCRLLLIQLNWRNWVWCCVDETFVPESLNHLLCSFHLQIPLRNRVWTDRTIVSPPWIGKLKACSVTACGRRRPMRWTRNWTPTLLQSYVIIIFMSFFLFDQISQSICTTVRVRQSEKWIIEICFLSPWLFVGPSASQMRRHLSFPKAAWREQNQRIRFPLEHIAHIDCLCVSLHHCIHVRFDGNSPAGQRQSGAQCDHGRFTIDHLKAWHLFCNNRTGIHSEGLSYQRFGKRTGCGQWGDRKHIVASLQPHQWFLQRTNIGDQAQNRKNRSTKSMWWAGYGIDSGSGGGSSNGNQHTNACGEQRTPATYQCRR